MLQMFCYFTAELFSLQLALKWMDLVEDIPAYCRDGVGLGDL